MKTDTVRQQFIKDAVKSYALKHPKDYKTHVEHVKAKRATRRNKYATDKAMDLQWGLSIPKPLHDTLFFSLDNPKFLESKEEYRWFMRTFPDLRVAEKV